MTKAIFRAIWLVATLTLLISFLGLTWGTYNSFSDQQRQSLGNQLDALVQIVDQQGAQSIMTLEMDDYRLTLIAADGAVVYDSEVATQDLANHAKREEVQEALEIGRGESMRYSTTVVEQTVYQAKRLASGQILRLSVSYASFLGTLRELWVLMVMFFIISLFLAYWVAKVLARQIMTPINQIDLEHPLTSSVYDEFSPLLSRLSQLNRLNKEQIEVIRQRENELGLITRQMEEGLIILNSQNKIISLNESACRIFSIKQDLVGEPFFRINHTYDLKMALEKAKISGYERIFVKDDHKEYQMTISRAQEGTAIRGLVLLIVDVTEQKQVERMRREFTANVSHELKTPLQTIMGASEMMARGWVTEEDQPRFIGQIREEATRLLHLIEDSMRLSQLDEQAVLAKEAINLKDLAERVVSSLQEAARLKGIQLVTNLTDLTMIGQPRFLHDIIYNLVDNAIRYSPEKTKVEIELKEDADHMYLIVTDQGMGIAEAEQARVFERFYRVDKSHSRKTGGTGLGLSIVKNAVDYHGGSIQLHSQLGVGSRFTIIFDKTN